MRLKNFTLLILTLACFQVFVAKAQPGCVNVTCQGPVTFSADPLTCQFCDSGVFNNLQMTPPPSSVTIGWADRYVTYTGTSVNGGGTSAIVQPGATVNLSYHMSVSFNYSTGYCPGCVVQIYIGIGGTNQTITCDNYIGDGYSTSHNTNFTAPTNPGVYYLTLNGSLQYYCVPVGFGNNANDAIAVIVVSANPSVTDACAGIASVTNNAPACFPVGNTQVTWTVTDSAGNVDSCHEQVTVTPSGLTIFCPGNISVNNVSGTCSAPVNYTVSAGSCSSTVTVVSTPASGSIFPIGTTTVNSTATDTLGNTTSCSFDVTVVDTTAPVITCPGNITVSTDPTICGAVVNFNVSATDACGSVTVVSNPPSGSMFPTGITTVINTATDFAGNTATCTFNVTVIDSTPPLITGCPQNITVSNDSGVCGAVVNFNTPLAMANCGNVSSVSFAYTGAYQSWTVPAGVTAVTINAAGATGGSDSYYGQPGGNGALVQTTLNVTPGEVLYINVGGYGGNFNSGGYNGGGSPSQDGYGDSGGGGGGFSQVGTTGNMLTDTLVVAAGGGGAGDDCGSGLEDGGAGGGPNGGTGLDCGTADGGGATQTNGGGSNLNSGSFMQGGNGNSNTGYYNGGGGGGGYYGGGAGLYGAGGGGSSYVTPVGSINTVYVGGNNSSGNGYVNISYNTPFNTTQTAGLHQGQLSLWEQL